MTVLSNLIDSKSVSLVGLFFFGGGGQQHYIYYNNCDFRERERKRDIQDTKQMPIIEI